jgi:hypothetical protein
MKHTLKLSLFVVTISTAGILAACGGGGGDAPASGTMAVSLTDAPACGFDAVNVTVSKVRIHQSSTANTNDAGWTDITLNPARKINLVNLTNGILDSLGQTSLPAGHYTQLRLVLAADTAGSTLNNSVLPTGGVETALVTPSAAQSGIKLIGQFDVAANTQSDVVLDFDACKSVVTRGNGSYGLMPVISTTVKTTSGSISGQLDTALLASHPVINAEINGVIVKSTIPDATGSFTLSPLVASSTSGNYAVVITADAHATEVIDNVPVTVQTNTPISTSAAPITLPASSTNNTVSGTVSPASDSPVITASQNFAGGPTIAVAFKNADTTTGAYSMTLPGAAPLLGHFGTLPITATAATALAGQYSINATGTTTAGATVSAPAATVSTSSGNVSQSFTLQ